MSGVRSQRWRSRVRSLLIIMTLSLLCLEGLIRTATLPSDLLSRTRAESQRVYDRYGQLLRALPNSEGLKQIEISYEQVSPHFVHALLCLEDRGFWTHSGVPIRGVVRALWANLKAGRRVAGGSGLTQQVIKLHQGRARGLRSKLREAIQAYALERRLSKEEILTLYLNRAPFGSRYQGLEAAALGYFRVSAWMLSPGQAAYLATLPYAPTRLNPRRAPSAASARRRKALKCMLKGDHLSREMYQIALETPLKIEDPLQPFDAPHLISSWRSGEIPEAPPVDRLETEELSLTIDVELQRFAENAARRQVLALKDRGVEQVAAVALSIDRGEVIFWVGSAGFFDSPQGQYDRVLSLRQPGSTLKPFLYGLALDRGHPLASKIPDRPLSFNTPFGQYRPRNYSGRTQGEVLFPYALAESLNIPAVWMLYRYGIDALLQRLKSAGMRELDQDASHYGLGLALGDGEVRLINLVNSYRALALGGHLQPWRLTLPKSPPKDIDLEPTPMSSEQSSRFLSRRSAQLITYILSQPRFRAKSFGVGPPLTLPFPSAVKTGTTQGYTTAWTVGFSSKFVVGVWISGSSHHRMNKVTGAVGAGPLWAQLMRRLHHDAPPSPLPQDALTDEDLQTLSSLLDPPEAPSAVRPTIASPPPRSARAQSPLVITYPASGAQLNLSPHTPLSLRRTRVQAHLNQSLLPSNYESLAAPLSLKWTLNGAPLSAPTNTPLTPWVQLEIGEHKLCGALLGRGGDDYKPSCVRFVVRAPAE
jgi:penicillin-binding protein 1C